MPRLLDLFCGAGGATRGYQFAGFHVTGIDNKPQPRYCGDAFYQADALDYLAAHGHEFDVIHASPPCQAFSDMRHAPAAKDGHPRLIAPVRDALRRLSRPYVIENVEGAPLIDPVMLCGSQFGLGVAGFQLRRHRLFESTIPLHPRACCHDGPVIGVYGGHVRCRAARFWRHGGADFPDRDKPALAAEAMGIDWMTLAELSQAIPPAYTRHIGAQLIAA